MRSEPDLTIDSLEILRSIVARMRSMKLEANAPPGGVIDQTIWDLAARKIEITMRKVDSWISTGVEIKFGPISQEILGTMPAKAADGFGDCIDGKLNGVQLENDSYEMFEGFNNPLIVTDYGPQSWFWESDLFDEMEMSQSFLYDGVSDWNFAAPNML